MAFSAVLPRPRATSGFLNFQFIAHRKRESFVGFYEADSYYFFSLKLYHVKLFTGLYVGKVSVFSQQGFDQSKNTVWKIPYG